MKKNDIIYVERTARSIDTKIAEPRLMLFQREFQGDEDISMHGSPLYKKFVVCIDPASGKEYTLGDQDYHWRDAMSEIKNLQKTIRKIHSLSAYI